MKATKQVFLLSLITSTFALPGKGYRSSLASSKVYKSVESSSENAYATVSPSSDNVYETNSYSTNDNSDTSEIVSSTAEPVYATANPYSMASYITTVEDSSEETETDSSEVIYNTQAVYQQAPVSNNFVQNNKGNGNTQNNIINYNNNNIKQVIQNKPYYTLASSKSDCETKTTESSEETDYTTE
ncbi:hypothetical protein BB561_005694, partial [Smittium simulii]